MNPPPRARGKGTISYKICPLFTYSICYWDLNRHFLIWVFFCLDFHREDLHWDGNFLEVNFPGEIFHWGNLTKFLYEFFFTVLYSLCQIKFPCGDAPRELSRGYFSRVLVFGNKIQRKEVYPATEIN